jgi:hypothetical protein
VKLVAATLEQSLVNEKPLRLIADRAYDSDPLRELIAPRGDTAFSAAPSWTNQSPPSTMAGGYAATPSAGKSNAFSPGFTTSAGSSFAGNITPRTISPFFNLDAQLSF